MKKKVGTSGFVRYNVHIEQRNLYHILILDDKPYGICILFDILNKFKMYGKSEKIVEKGEKTAI